MTRKPAQSLVKHRVKLIRTSDPQSLVPADVVGTVVAVSESGLIDVDWDNGQKTIMDFAAGDRWQVVLTER